MTIAGLMSNRPSFLDTEPMNITIQIDEKYQFIMDDKFHMTVYVGEGGYGAKWTLIRDPAEKTEWKLVQ